MERTEINTNDDIRPQQENHYRQEAGNKLVVTGAAPIIVNPQPYMVPQPYMGGGYPQMNPQFNQAPPAMPAMGYNYAAGVQHQSDGYGIPPQPYMPPQPQYDQNGVPYGNAYPMAYPGAQAPNNGN